jgi:hypothetical protein
MAHRIRWCARFAGTFLPWVDKTDTNPSHPWTGHVLSRHPFKPCDENYPCPNEEVAKEAVENTIRNGFAGYAHRLEKELKWEACDLSDDEWEQERARFIESGE